MLVSAVAMAFVGGAGAASTDDIDSLASQAAPDNVTADTILGDVNENDNIGLSDAILIQEEVVGIRDPGTAFDADAADLNRDGSISLTDAILVQEKAVGILNEGEITVSNLDAPDTAQSGSEIDVSADLENLGDEGALQDVEVRLAPAGEPLDENATIATKFVDMAASGTSSPVDRPAQTTIAFENLTVEVPAGEYEIGIFSDDNSETTPLTVTVAGGTVSGTVTASGNTSTDQTPGSGEPISGANVTVYEGNSTAPGDEVANATTDADGEYVVGNLSAGQYTVEVSASDFGTDSALVSLGTDEGVQQDFALDYAEAGSISGNVTLDVVDGNEDVTVTVEVTETGDSTQVTLAGENDTASYTISGVDVNVDDGYTVSASADSTNYTDPADATGVLVDVGETTGNVDFAFERLTGSINGTVTASGGTAQPENTPGAGEPISGANVTVYEGKSTDPADEVANTTTGADGEYVVDDLPDREYTVEVEAADFTTESALVTVEADAATTQDFALDYAEAGAISGTLSLDVVDPGEDVTVTVDVVETSDSTQVTITGDNDTASYTISGVDVNVDDGYTVSASATNYASASDTNVTVDVGTTTEDVNLSLSRLTGDLDGTVTEASTGDPVDGATVEVFAWGEGGPSVATATTDANGDYSIPDLPVGTHYVNVTADMLKDGNATVTINDGATTNQNFALEEPDPAFFDVSVVSSNNETAAGSTQTFDVQVTNTGDQSGTQTLTLDWGSGQYTDSTQVSVDPGETTTEQLSVTLSGSQAMDTYGVTVTSDDDTDSMQAKVGPERSLDKTQVSPGGTVQVTISGEVSSSSELNLADAWSPDADGDANVVSSTFTRDFTITSAGDVVIAFQEDQGTFELVYEITVPSDSGGQTYQWEGETSQLEIDGVSFPILGDQQFDVTSATAVASMSDRLDAVIR
jgi:hypothetical protein